MCWFAVFLVAACSEPRRPSDRPQGHETGTPPAFVPPLTDTPEVEVQPPHNILLVVLDDWGADSFGRLGNPLPDAFPVTPTLDALADEGLLFRNVWAAPVCSPSRAMLLTGRLPRRTGIGAAIQTWEVDVGLSHDEVTIPEMLTEQADRPWSSAALGKWHLGTPLTGYGEDPLIQGFQSHRGSLYSIGDASLLEDGTTSYGHWEKNVDGDVFWSDRYPTTDTADEAIWAARALPEPWFLYVAFNAPHAPFHHPPAELLTEPGASGASLASKYRSMIEAVDSELGRMLAGIGPDTLARTTVVVVGDNGTPTEIAAWLPEGHAKASLQEGGVRVPMIVNSPVLPYGGATSDALVMATDLFGTVAELAGVEDWDHADLDSVSLVPYLLDPDHPSLRDTIFSEKLTPNGPPPYEHTGRAIRDARWKVLVMSDPAFETITFYDLAAADQGFTPTDLRAAGPLAPDAQEAFDRLWNELETRYPPLPLQK